MTEALNEWGIRVGHHRVGRLMRLNTGQTGGEVEVAPVPVHGLKANDCRATEYSSSFCNLLPRHSALGWKSPGTLAHRAA